jgi:DNA repair protein RecN (Recombination protein N)
MLRALSIRDFVILDRLDLEFQPGFTVLTGETGAGKSILVDALMLVLGARSDTAQVRQGAARADISAEFALDGAPQAVDWLQGSDLAEDTGVCLLRRVLEASGRSRAYINGRPATLQQVKELGELLVDIHGQHEHQSLARASVQRQMLDAYAGALQLAERAYEAWHAWQALQRQREASLRDADAMAQERGRLEFQQKELARLGFTSEEWATLQVDHKRLAHAAGLLEAVEHALERLSEGEAAALAAASSAVARLTAAAEYDPALCETLEVLDSAQIQLQEAVYGLRHYRNRIDLDPRRLTEVEHRLESIHFAARKYRVGPECLPQTLEEVEARLAELSSSADPEELARREAAAAQAYADAAAPLSRERARAGQAFARRVTEQMQTLGLAGGRFEIELAPLPEGSAQGSEHIAFLVAANPGVPARPLAKVASGGELSRISLAIQALATEVAQVPTLVFDEVDAGIGGRVAEIVGRMLAGLGQRHQVMCITHLPQVAAAADRQLQVIKAPVDGGVRSEVKQLDRAQRVEEIARMLGGLKITETTRKHAAEMLGHKR